MGIRDCFGEKTASARRRSSSAPIQACAVLALCTGLAAARASVAASSLVVSDPWMRAIAAPVPAAAYFILSNTSDTPRTLVGLSSPDCGELMMHQSRNVNGVGAMVMVARRIAPPHGRIVFAPGGYHLMCLSPSKAVKPGRPHSRHASLRRRPASARPLPRARPGRMRDLRSGDGVGPWRRAG